MWGSYTRATPEPRLTGWGSGVALVLVLVPTIRDTKDNAQKGPGWLDAEWESCIQPIGALLDVVLSAPDDKHQHWGGCCTGGASWAPVGPLGVATVREGIIAYEHIYASFFDPT
jgi:hypothetical protein